MSTGFGRHSWAIAYFPRGPAGQGTAVQVLDGSGDPLWFESESKARSYLREIFEEDQPRDPQNYRVVKMERTLLLA